MRKVQSARLEEQFDKYDQNLTEGQMETFSEIAGLTSNLFTA